MKPRCYRCGKKRAKIVMPHMETDPTFCSLRCAATQGVFSVTLDQDIEWCKKHGIWHDAGEECDMCWEDEYEKENRP